MQTIAAETVMLEDATVLIVEDEPFVALDIAAGVEDAGGVVIGPAGSVREALLLIEGRSITAAILDVDLSDRDVTPVAELLLARGVPLLFHTGVGLPEPLRLRHPDLLVHTKPMSGSRLVEILEQLIRDAA